MNPSIIITAADLASPAIAGVRNNLALLLKEFGSFGSLGNKLSLPLLGISAAIAGIAGAVGNAINVTKWVDDLGDAGSALGISADNMARYQILAKQAGIEATNLGGSFAHLAKQVEGAKEGQGEQIELFRRFGISAKELKALNFDQLLERMAIASGKWEAGTAKSALQTEAFAKAGKRMDDVLQKIATGQEVNTGLSKDFEERTKKLNTELEKAEIAWKRYSVTIAGPVVDALNLLARTFGLSEKSPAEHRKQLEAQIERLKGMVAESAKAAESAGTRPWDEKFLNARLAKLKELELQLEKVNAADPMGPDEALKPPPPKRDFAGAEAAKKKFDQETKEILKEQREMALKIQAATEAESDKRQDARNRFMFREFEEQKEHDQKMLELADRMDKAENEAAGEGIERLRKRRQEVLEENEKRMEDLLNITESFFTRLQEFDGTNVFKALGKDLLQLGYRLLILQPILERMKALLRDMAESTDRGSSGSGFIGILMKLFGLVGTGSSTGSAVGVSGGTEWNALGGPASFAQMVGEAGPELFIPKSAGTIIPNHRMNGSMGSVSIVNNNIIDSRTDRGTIAAMLEANRQATLRDVREQLARRGTMLRV